MIDVQSVTKRFGQHLAVDNVSFSLERGVIMGLLGPNGAGKTTIMRMITGYMPPTEGRVVIDGMDMYEQPTDVKKKIGYLPEHPPLYLDMTVKEYLLFAAEIRGVEKGERENRVEQVAEMCGISDMLNRLVGNLSKGYRQRVGLAQALVHEPEILVLDEPTVGLDPRQIVEIRSLIREFGRDRTTILSTHILQEVTSICSRVAIINNGRLVVNDHIENLSRGMSSTERLRIKVSRPEKINRERLEAIEGVSNIIEESAGWLSVELVRDDSVRERIVSQVVYDGAGLLELKEEDMSIEDIFLKVISR